MREIAELTKRLAKLEQKVADQNVSFKMRDGSVCTLSQSQMADENNAYISWVMAMADPTVRASDGSLLHALNQAVAGIEEKAAFVPWAQYKTRWDAAMATAGVDDLS